jgi:hypothetical protein
MTDQEAFEAVVGLVAKALNPPVNVPLTEHPWLEPQGQSTLHPFKRDFDGSPLDVGKIEAERSAA